MRTSSRRRAGPLLHHTATLGDVIVTGALFCDAANISNGKVNILGGVWDWLALDLAQPFSFSITLVVLTQMEPGDAGQGSVKIEILSPTGGRIREVDASGSFPGEANLGFFVLNFPVEFTEYGKHVFIVGGNTGDPWSMALDVRLPANNVT